MRRAQREEQVFFTQAPVEYITGWTPVERTDTIVYNWADYNAVPHYTIGAIPTDEGYITRDQYQVWYDGRNQTTWDPNIAAGRAYELYQWWVERNAEREARTAREMEEYIAQERRYEATLEEALEQYDTQREQERMIEMILQGGNRERDNDRADYSDFTEVPDASWVTLLRESDYIRMEREWRLDPSAIYYTYPDTDDGLTAPWTERHPKIVKITYFIE